MRQLVIGSAHLGRLDASSRWAEGPVYFPAGDYLLWSDIPNNRVMQWAEGMGVRVLFAQRQQLQRRHPRFAAAAA